MYGCVFEEGTKTPNDVFSQRERERERERERVGERDDKSKS